MYYKISFRYFRYIESVFLPQLLSPENDFPSFSTKMLGREFVQPREYEIPEIATDLQIAGVTTRLYLARYRIFMTSTFVAINHEESSLRSTCARARLDRIARLESHVYDFLCRARKTRDSIPDANSDVARGTTSDVFNPDRPARFRSLCSRRRIRRQQLRRQQITCQGTFSYCNPAAMSPRRRRSYAKRYGAVRGASSYSVRTDGLALSHWTRFTTRGG